MAEHKPKLLVVDDEPDQSASIESYFSKRGFLVFTAATGEEALRIIKDNAPDMVLLDKKLSSNMDGLDVLRVLRQHDKDTKVAIVTGDVLSGEERKEITGLGIVEFLDKPVDIKTLEDVVKKALLKSYSKAARFEKIKPQTDPAEISLRRINHELANIANDIAGKCELYLLDTEEGLYKNKTEKERLAIADNVIQSVSRAAERIKGIVEKFSMLTKKEN